MPGHGAAAVTARGTLLAAPGPRRHQIAGRDPWAVYLRHDSVLSKRMLRDIEGFLYGG